MKKKLFLRLSGLDLGNRWEKRWGNWSYFLVRVGVAGMMFFSHGVGKFTNFSQIAPRFPDPLGLGSTLSLALVTGAEFFGAILLALGLFTRWASFSLFFTMFVVVFVVHWPNGLKEEELAAIYGLLFLLFTASGGGKYSLDSLLKKK